MRIRHVYGVGALCGAVMLGMLATPIVGQFRKDPLAPCCAIKRIDARTRTVVVTETATGCSLEFGVNSADELTAFKVGAAMTLDVKLLHPEPQMSSTGQAASGAGGTTSCGSNVGRYASTKTCFATVNGKVVSVPCTK